MKFHHYLRFFLMVALFSANFIFSLPVVTNLSPAIGPTSGGTVIVITGSGFSGATAVDFGTLPAAFIVNSDTTITAVNPAHAPQVVPVIVTTPSGISPVNENTYFTYQGNWKAYVTQTDNAGTVFVIDVQSNFVIATIPVGSFPSGVAFTADGSEALVINESDNTISVIRVVDNTVTDTLSGGLSLPDNVSITPNMTKAYVSNFDTNITAVDLATNLLTNIPISPTGEPILTAILNNSTRAYTLDILDGVVYVIDVPTDTIIDTITVGAGPVAISITPDQTKAYVVNFNDNNISVIDLTTDLVTTTIPVGLGPESIAITPDGTLAFSTNSTDATISVIDVATDTVINTINVGSDPGGIIITPDGTKVYVANYNDNTVSVIDVASQTVIDTVPVGIFPYGIAISPDGRQVYVVSDGANTVTVINTSMDTPQTIFVGDEPALLVITPDQAPLARFTQTIGGAGQPTIFDASASTSPTGLIANYFWDFGDGNTLNTANPIVAHTYAVPIMYLVTLTVTNTAGTSTTQIFNYSSLSLFFEYGATIPLVNNGGPTATTSHVLAIGLLPPTNITGSTCKDNFAMQTDCVKTITWSPSPSPGVTSYYIRRNGILIQIVPASGPFVFVDHDRCRQVDTYTVTAFNALGQESTPATVVIN